MSIEELAEVSRYYGVNPDYVIAGGGNTSFKDGDTLYVKGSGMALADAVPEAFVRMDRKALSRIWEKNYPADSADREKAVLADLMAARMPGEEQKRPSVETMLHDLLPFDFVVHLHPALVNGLTCSRQGEAAMKEIFSGDALWIPSASPGYILSRKVKIALDEHKAKHGRSAGMLFLQNHGIFVGGQNGEHIKKIYGEVMDRLEKIIQKRPDFSPDVPSEISAESRNTPEEFASALAEVSGGKTAFLRNREIANLVKDRSSFYPVSSAFTPDHIVYAGSDPLFMEAGTAAAGRENWNSHVAKCGRPPKIVAVQGLGVFGLGASERAAALALELFKDTIKVAVYADSFGGPQFMSRDQIDFINNWEVEQFRTQVSAK
jgi:rhamnose utilization protein RhaD (predicted bifunctional aldolase and dehydrogenase)